MARPQTFDEAAVLEAAMHLFWTQGYVATGMAQILQVTQLKPGSLYNKFSNKKTLFIRSVEHYIAGVVTDRTQCMLDAQDPIRGLEEFFFSVIDVLPDQKLIGCLLTNTAAELGQEDLDISAVVNAGLRKIELTIKGRIVAAKNAQLVSAELDPEKTALHLLSCYQGMLVIGQVTQNKAKLRSIARSALQVLR